MMTGATMNRPADTAKNGESFGDFDSEPKILVISSDKYPPFRVDVTVLFGKELARRGISVDWLLQSAGVCEENFQVQWGSGTIWVGQTDVGVSRLRRLRKHLLGFANDLRVRLLVRNGNYNIVQVKDKVLAAIPALLAARKSGAAFVYWLTFPHPEASLHVARIGEARYPILYRIRGWLQFFLLYKVILACADHIFVQSEQMKRDLIGYGISHKKMTPVPMGIDLETFSGIEYSPGDASGAPVIAYLGTLAAERKMGFLVRCLALVVQEIPDCTLMLVGDSDRREDVEELRAEARGLNVSDRVKITGFMPQKDALRLISKATVCVSPFYPTPILNSTSPTKLVEYMALGCPVVANDHPEQREIIRASGAGYCVAYDEAEFAQAILQIIRNPEEGAAMGARGAAYVREHRHYGRLADVVESQYRRIVSSLGMTRTDSSASG
jgi:glycosyltransferase involved in cell wall biosynthesis